MSCRHSAASTPLDAGLIDRLSKIDRGILERLADEGDASIFNPLIGASAAQTLGNVSDALVLLGHILDSTDTAIEMMPGLRQYVGAIWAAAHLHAARSAL